MEPQNIVCKYCKQPEKDHGESKLCFAKGSIKFEPIELEYELCPQCGELVLKGLSKFHHVKENNPRSCSGNNCHKVLNGEGAWILDLNGERYFLCNNCYKECATWTESL